MISQSPDLISASVIPVTEPDLAVRPAAVALRRGVTSLGRRLRMERVSGGLTAAELSVLAHLNRRGPLNPGELAAVERVQPQSLTRTLGELERGGHVSRTADAADGRRALLAITQAGVDALRAEMEQRDNWLAVAMKGLTPTEAELLRLAGELIEQLADADAPPPPPSPHQPNRRLPSQVIHDHEDFGVAGGT
jgi:DNA-binding MarR family transcriptional regulator